MLVAAPTSRTRLSSDIRRLVFAARELPSVTETRPFAPRSSRIRFGLQRLGPAMACPPRGNRIRRAQLRIARHRLGAPFSIRRDTHVALAGREACAFSRRGGNALVGDYRRHPIFGRATAAVAPMAKTGKVNALAVNCRGTRQSVTRHADHRRSASARLRLSLQPRIRRQSRHSDGDHLEVDGCGPQSGNAAGGEGEDRRRRRDHDSNDAR
jgi:hypothetical protein